MRRGGREWKQEIGGIASELRKIPAGSPDVQATRNSLDQHVDYRDGHP